MSLDLEAIKARCAAARTEVLWMNFEQHTQTSLF